jgi:hypothetical protein
MWLDIGARQDQVEDIDIPAIRSPTTSHLPVLACEVWVSIPDETMP